MEIIDFYTNSQAHKMISSDLMTGMLNHCYLLSSADKVLLDEYAISMAKEILCLSDIKPCNKCNNCEKINHSNMVDLKIYPEYDKTLVVEDITEIVSDCYIRPVENKYKIYILKYFDECTVQGQNKILKTLEDPPQNVIFILTCSNINNVIPTILSRTKKILESTLSIDAIERFLEDKKVANSGVVASISNGNITTALKLSGNSNVGNIIELVFDVLLNLKSSSDVLEYSSKILFLKKDIEFFVNTFISVLRDISVFCANGELVFKNRREEYAVLSKIYSYDMIERIMRKATLIFNKMEFNCNMTGVIDKFLLDILEVKFLWQK